MLNVIDRPRCLLQSDHLTYCNHQPDFFRMIALALKRIVRLVRENDTFFRNVALLLLVNRVKMPSFQYLPPSQQTSWKATFVVDSAFPLKRPSLSRLQHSTANSGALLATYTNSFRMQDTRRLSRTATFSPHCYFLSLESYSNNRMLLKYSSLSDFASPGTFDNFSFMHARTPGFNKGWDRPPGRSAFIASARWNDGSWDCSRLCLT